MTISTGESLITAADIDDLITRVRQTAGDPGPLESAKAALFSGDGDGDCDGTRTGPGPEAARLIRQRLLVTALRHGGALLAKLLSRLSPRETAMVRRYAHRLANFLDTLEVWAAQPIMLALMRFGLPYGEAETIAVAVLLLVG
ncbi:hypothetical protein [Streptomyces rapamycinicus]|uniref:Uncharacterized protein n=2 Tax=Streptomyces rapamycinicus TaxID=1226757 RepID=A0A0A0NBS5_STRRN|nr:hypothetical protein [Streptomyces rapamycinicus]AGP54741.1 hypothetical protein M271_15835 [Streptomyces rapamycinicus NRRL 5491]MBB4782262.1 hypothetical protein [Streptomyces rapamycinicus]RLV82254.1 hypothetical protein D3C57_127755 [Streptomyces rapamycinicus NRRL 5491]UTO62790.1 hypothetical protein LJB45_10975 [Streptomyces rapamycinicus]UTP30748.1 hypothetical protein LIV37_16090 [Streptomyces rapamycinicus NRRL 5491]